MAGYAVPQEFEDRLISQAFQQDQAAGLEALYKRYRALVRQFCRSRLANSSDVDDACQETLLRAYRGLRRFRPGARIWPWLATIAANVCRDINRKGEVLVALPRGNAASEGVDGPEEEVARHIRREVVQEALATLPEHYREHLFLKDYEGWTYEQIAEFRGITVPSVASTLKRARRLLKVQVETIARERRQWPLPAFVPSGWLRLRSLARGRLDALRNNATSSWARFVVFSGLESMSAGLLGQVAVSGILALAITLGVAVEQPSVSLQTRPGGASASTGSQVPEGSGGYTRGFSTSVTVGASGSEASTSTTVTGTITREEERATLNAKIENRLGDENTWVRLGTDIYCDSGIVAGTTCYLVDALPDTPD